MTFVRKHRPGKGKGSRCDRERGSPLNTKELVSVFSCCLQKQEVYFNAYHESFQLGLLLTEPLCCQGYYSRDPSKTQFWILISAVFLSGRRLRGLEASGSDSVSGSAAEAEKDVWGKITRRTCREMWRLRGETDQCLKQTGSSADAEHSSAAVKPCKYVHRFNTLYIISFQSH